MVLARSYQIFLPKKNLCACFTIRINYCKPENHLGREGPREKTKTVLKSEKQWEQPGSMQNWKFQTFLNKNYPTWRSVSIDRFSFQSLTFQFKLSIQITRTTWRPDFQPCFRPMKTRLCDYPLKITNALSCAHPLQGQGKGQDTVGVWWAFKWIFFWQKCKSSHLIARFSTFSIPLLTC